MKYIDADRLKAEIERRKVQHQQDYESGDTTEFHRIVEDDAIAGVIDSFQQDPRFPQYDNIVDKVFGAGNLESWGYEEAEMLVALAKEELLNSLQQEQPEVDLENEIGTYFQGWTNGDDYYQALNAEGECVSTDEIIEIARQFFNLGLNARKV